MKPGGTKFRPEQTKFRTVGHILTQIAEQIKAAVSRTTATSHVV
jgi:hypothetical protein